MTGTITLPREELKAARDFIEVAHQGEFPTLVFDTQKILDSLNSRLAQQEEKPEPAAFGIIACNTGKICEVALDADEVAEIHPRYIAPLYTAPPKREWQGLTDDERKEIFESMPGGMIGFLRTWGWLPFTKAIEAKLKDKNQ